MRSKRKKNKNLIDISKIIPKKINLDKIKLPEIISIDKTKKKIENIYTKYKLNKKKENLKAQKEKKLQQKKELLKEKNKLKKRD